MTLCKEAGFVIVSIAMACALLLCDGALSPVRAESGEGDLYVLGLYEGHTHKNGKVKVLVSVTDRPISLLLSAYESVEWQIELAKGARLERVYLSGYHIQQVTGLPSEIPVFSTSYEQGSQFYVYGGRGRCANLTGRVQAVIGVKVSRHLCQYQGSAFLIDQQGIRALQDRDGFSGYGVIERQERAILLPPIQQAVVYPKTTGTGSLNAERLEKYRTIAVSDFVAAPGVPQSGALVGGMLAGQLMRRGFAVVERSKLQQLTEEQRFQLMRGDETRDPIKIGKLSGAKAIVLGEVTQWTIERGIDQRGQPYKGSLVSLSLRLVDVETAEVLFTGDGYFSTPATSSPEGAAHLIVRAIVTRLAVEVGLVSTGRTGFNWTLQHKSGSPVLVVTDFDSNSPAHDAGLRSGDNVLSCNRVGGQAWRTQWDAMRACEVEAGQTLSLEVLRGREHLQIEIQADNRFRGGQSENPIPPSEQRN